MCGVRGELRQSESDIAKWALSYIRMHSGERHHIFTTHPSSRCNILNYTQDTLSSHIFYMLFTDSRTSIS